MSIVDKNELHSNLKSGIVKVTFTKVDGSTRIMTCTLSENLIPAREPSETTRTKKPNDNVCSVWATDVNGWRSFRYDSVQTVEVIND